MQIVLIIVGITATVTLGLAGYVLSAGHKILSVWILFVSLVIYSLLLCLYLQDYFSENNIPVQETNVVLQKDTADKRVFVDLTPEYLLSFYDNKTTAQGNKLAENYLNKWMKVSGKISNVLPVENSKPLTILVYIQNSSASLISCRAENAAFIDYAQTLRIGQMVEIQGQIDQINSMQLDLKNCEFVDKSSK